jgi:iron(III) transport system permease protein
MALRGIPGVLLVHTFTMYPYFYLSTAAALAQTDDSLEEAAHSLGASRFQTWTRVRLPMLTPALVAGALLTFMSSMGSYSAPLLFQADEVATVQIVQFRERNNLRLASALSVILALTSVIFLIILRGYERRADHRRQSKGAIHKRQPITHPIAKAALGVSVPMAAVLMTLPVAMIFLCAFMVEGSWQTSVLPSRYTMQNFAAVFHDARSWNVVIDSLQITTIALAGTILFGVACAYAITRLDFRGKRVLDILIMLPWALPGSVIAIDLIVAFNRPSLFGLGQTLVGTFAILPLAYFVRFSPLIFRSTTASLSQLDPNLDQAARSLGGTWWQAFRRVVLPLLSRGIMAGALLVFVSGIGEFVASMLLYGASGKPISVGIWEQYGNGHVGTSAALGVVQILLVSVLLVVSQSLERSRAMSARQVPTGRAARRIAALG